MARKLPNQDKLDKAIEYIDACQQHHRKIMDKVDKRADAYHAIVQAQAESWYSKLYPPYVMHIVETTLASMVEDRLTGRVKPRLTLEGQLDPAAKARSVAGAKAHEILLTWQGKHAKFTDVQRPFLLQNAIAGITVAKTYWVEETERRRRMVATDEPLLDEFEQPIVDPNTGQPQTTPQLKEEEGYVTTYDGPWTDVIDVHDFFWEESALELKRSRYVIHRIRLSRDELERGFQEGGPYGPDAGGWEWKQVEKKIGETKESKDEYTDRWGNKDVDHNKNLLQVWEVWDQFTKEVTTIVERDAIIAYKDQFPFFHERAPFTVCTTQTDLFKFVGISQVEKVAALQQMLWSLSNQRMDNLRLINNAIVMFNPALEDVDALEFAPGAMWPVESPDLVNMWAPNVIPAEVSPRDRGADQGRYAEPRLDVPVLVRRRVADGRPEDGNRRQHRHLARAALDRHGQAAGHAGLGVDPQRLGDPQPAVHPRSRRRRGARRGRRGEDRDHPAVDARGRLRV